jgi:hypothetical protein
MLKIIEDEPTIRRCQKQFAKSFEDFVDEKIPVTIGHPGASFKATVSWSRRFGIWISSKKIGSRYWNIFGIGCPDKGSAIPMTCEINFPASGIDRRVGGALARDHKGDIYIVHRGKIGGGKKGIGKLLFEGHYRGVWDVMEDGDTKSDVALIGSLHSHRFVRQVVQFIRKVDLIKNAVAHQSSQVEIAFDEIKFREEMVGFSYGQYGRKEEDICDHGLVVTDLAVILKDCGLKVGNDGSHDLFAVDKKGQVTIVYQVITGTSKPVLHKGIAGLLLSGLDFSNNPRLVLVLPQPLDESLETKLRHLKIELLVYKWQQDRAVFPGL